MILTRIFMQGPLRESHKIVIKGPAAGEALRRSWYKNLPWAPQKNFHANTCYVASARSSRKDLLERILPGFPQNLLTRTCARSCKDLLDLENFSRIFTRSSQKGLYKILQGTLTGFHQNLHNFFKTLAKILTLRTSKTAPWNTCTIVKEEPSGQPRRSLDQGQEIQQNPLSPDVASWKTWNFS